jgi:hypothetical protein
MKRFWAVLSLLFAILGIAAYALWQLLSTNLSEASRVALAAALITAAAAVLVSTVGSVSNFLTTEANAKRNADAEMSRRRDERQAEEHRRRHELLMAREGRIWGPRADTYQRVLELLNRNTEIVERTLPALERGQSPPEPASDEEVRHLDALVASFASRRVRELLRDLDATQRLFGRAVAKFQMVQVDVAAGTPAGAITANYGADPVQLHDAVEQARDAYIGLVQRIRDRVAEELTTDDAADAPTASEGPN